LGKSSVVENSGRELTVAGAWLEGKTIENKFLALNFAFFDELLEDLAGGDIEVIDAVAYTFERMRNGEPDVLLKKDEKLLIDLVAIDFKQWGKTRTSTPYQGATVRLAKGLSYRVGAINESNFKDELKTKDTHGTFFVTNKRYGYIGSKKSIDQPISKITSVETYSDGLMISRSNNQNPEYYILGNNWTKSPAIMAAGKLPLVEPTIRGLLINS
jgi:hypothetical protein